MALSLGAFANYAREPFRLRHCTPGPCSEAGATEHKVGVVKDMATLDLLGALVVIPRLQVGLRVPVSYVNGDGIDTDRASPNFGQGVAGGVSAIGVGDPTVEAKVRALGDAQSPIVLGAALWATAPLGHAIAESKFIGDSSPGVGLKAIVDGKAGRVFYAANVGGFLRESAQLGTLDLGTEARVGLGGGYAITERARVLVEAFGSSNLSKASGTNAGEVDAAAQLSPGSAPVQLTVGGGAGLNQGFGAPVFRVFAGVSTWTEGRAKSGAVVARVDRDGDGIDDSEDACPSEGGEVVRSPGRYYGCPYRDSDGDGITDSQDACPEQEGVKTADPATNGCPNPDRDGDGIPNELDKCPDAPETVNGVDDADGCPDVVPIQIEVRTDQIVVNEQINFEFNSNKIIGQRSFEALDLVAEVLKQHPEIRRLEIAGHADAVGPREENQVLSERRAASVGNYLISKGIERDRLLTRGYGYEQPVADNNTDDGRARNRRVEFKILVIAK